MVWHPKENQTVYNLDVAYGIVRERLSKVNIREQCQHSGAAQQPDGSVALSYLNQTYRFNLTNATASIAENAKPVSLREQILLLHYFVHSKGTPLTKTQVTYRDLPGGLVYYPTFVKRTLQPLTDCFGERPPLLVKAGVVVGASAGQMGDASLVIPAFPRVPVTIIVWRGDGELPPGVNLLFDANIIDYLESEDVTVVCETITWRLINHARTL